MCNVDLTPYCQNLTSNNIEDDFHVVFVLMKTTCTAEKLKGTRKKGQWFVSE